ncbi:MULTISPECIES: hypothetical protein [Rhizobium/Agrobacterium group]|uniref:hypothetical protein n=1 Tax=Rhizobium/Agrobacterium group TaxID=227290 RepID=UPI00107F92A4|nr:MULTISPECIES: hypothetical protein [Rhizobium/Agrobacterium group]MBB4403013.1 hypothetical protein [Agrobacterium radiobacter]MBB5589077.1 hypothetical protein [Agrobacterium radiobacter]TGE86074.1 hypothetical protein C9418_24595 [Rhizobium sp. SEMIA 4032]
MELVLTFAGLLAIAIALYLLLSQRGKHLRWQVKCLIFSVLVCLTAALWCAVYGPGLWVLIQAGTLIVLATITGFLSSPKK